MKKFLALALVFVMLFSFAACTSDTKPEDVRGETTGTESSAPTEEKEFSLGETEGKKYENKFVGLGCDLENDWTFYTDEQIKELNNITADMAGEEYENTIKGASLVYDMYAVAANQTDTIGVILEKSNALTVAALDIVKNFESAFPNLKQSLENMGYTNISHEIGKVEIDGEKYDSLNTTAEINGIKMYQKQINVKCKDYLATVTVTTFNEDKTNSIYDKFYAVK